MILASASPRRQELLEHAGLVLTIEPADIDETRRPGESPIELVGRLAKQKAHAAAAKHGLLAPGETLLAADTMVWTGDDVLGKPKDEHDARRMLSELSGRTHHVSTGVCLLVGTGAEPGERAFVETTAVTFRELSPAVIDAYVTTGEPMDKAGAYGIQGGAAAFVARLEGDYDNVVGLPVSRVLEELRNLGRGDVAVPESVNQIPGVFVAHATNAQAGTGCTVIVCPKGATGGVDVRGGAPATRETDLLRPEETVQELHAVVLSGGSAFGLAASCGVAEELERAGIGLNVGVGVVPIVSGACLFDLAVGDAGVRPTASDGAEAVRAALSQRDVPAEKRSPLAQGNVGAGTGCSVGKFAGPERCMKSGLGESVCTSGSLVCAAIAAVNACGDVLDPKTGRAIAGQLSADGTRIEDSAQTLRDFVATLPLDDSEASDAAGMPARTNTTISCVVTNACLSKAQATKVAQMSADAYAHVLRPAHTTNDGDTVFVMATGEVEAPVDVVGTLATKALGQAIANGARNAGSAYGLKAATDL